MEVTRFTALVAGSRVRKEGGDCTCTGLQGAQRQQRSNRELRTATGTSRKSRTEQPSRVPLG